MEIRRVLKAALSIVLVITVGCSVRIKSSSISELQSNESRTFKDSAPTNNTRVLAAFSRAREIAGVPSDFAIPFVYSDQIPRAFASVTNRIYLSSSMEENLLLNEMTSDELTALVIHEIFHLKHEHTYALLSRTSVDFFAADDPLSAVHSAARIGELRALTKLRSDNPYTFGRLATWNTIARATEPDEAKYKLVENFRQNIFGYPYSIDDEISADSFTIGLMRQNGISPDALKRLLEYQLQLAIRLQAKETESQLRIRLSRLKEP